VIPVSDGTRSALTVAAGGLGLGVLAEILFHGALPGVNVILWVLAAAGLIGWWSRRAATPLDRQVRLLAVPALFFASVPAWRDAPSAVMLSLLMLGLTAAAAVAAAQGGRLAAVDLLEFVLRLLAATVSVVGGPLRLLAGDAAWGELSRGETRRTAAAVARGLVLALPVLLIFGMLFASADPVFAELLGRALNLHLSGAAVRLLYVLLWAWPAAGLLRALTRPERREVPMPPPDIGRPVGIVEGATVLGAVNALFLTFVLVQVRYLFGGAALVQETVGLTYAEYARRGFFELTLAAALVVPLLVAVDGLVPRREPRHQRLLRGLVLALVAQVYVTLASAVYRMILYQQAYGLTELRLVVMFFLGWLAFVLAWLAFTMLAGRRERFVAGALVAGYVAAAALAAANPHGLVARANLDHYAATGRFDAVYNAELGGDAVPALVQALPELSEEERTVVAGILLHRWGWLRPEAASWRSWNLARQRAAAAVAAHRLELAEAAGRR